MMKIKIATMGLLFFLGILLVAGCSTKGSSTTTTPSPSLEPSFYLPEVPRISVEEGISKLDAGINLVLIDSRSEDSYNKSHIVGAISIPLKTMADPYNYLDSYAEIVTY